MKKLFLMLLSVACVSLLGCNNKEEVVNNSTDPAQPVETEADFVFKFYTSDSLLQYVTYTIVDENNTPVASANYTIAKPDTAKADKEDWQLSIDKAITFFEAQDIWTVDNTKIISLKVHLQRSSQNHAYQIKYVRNNVPAHSDTINVILGGAIWKITPQRTDYLRMNTTGHKGIYTDQLSTFFNLKAVVNDCTLSCLY